MIVKIDKCKILLMFLLIYLTGSEKDKSLVYILKWAKSHLWLVPDNETGQQYFINKKCRFQNCFLTNDQSYFSDVRDFDVILFHAVIVHEPEIALPSVRMDTQKYIFMSDEPSVSYPLQSHYDEYFNYTFTYKLSSDTTWRFFIVKNKDGDVIAPKEDVAWINIKDMEPIGEDIKLKLRNKNKAAAWFVSHCETPSQRETYVRRLNYELENYKLRIDIFGYCGHFNCTKEECPVLVELDYYFYLVFENSMCEDYVTEKLLIATKNFAVPVVYGGANYSRFIPQGSYLNADALGPHELARMMNNTIHDKEQYYDFFKWHAYYSFHAHNEMADADEICALCAMMKSTSILAVFINT